MLALQLAQAVTGSACLKVVGTRWFEVERLPAMRTFPQVIIVFDAMFEVEFCKVARKRPRLPGASVANRMAMLIRLMVDRDGDGHSPWLGGTDCDDSNATLAVWGTPIFRIFNSCPRSRSGSLVHFRRHHPRVMQCLLVTGEPIPLKSTRSVFDVLSKHGAKTAAVMRDIVYETIVRNWSPGYGYPLARRLNKLDQLRWGFRKDAWGGTDCPLHDPQATPSQPTRGQFCPRAPVAFCRNVPNEGCAP